LKYNTDSLTVEPPFFFYNVFQNELSLSSIVISSDRYISNLLQLTLGLVRVLGTFEDNFMLPPGASIQDAFDGITHWRRVIAIGTKYSISVRGTSIKLKASWPSKPTIGGNLLSPINPLGNIIRMSGVLGGPEMTMDLTLTEIANGVRVDAFLEGATDRGMGDYRNLKTHLLTGNGIPDREFDRYLTEQTKKPPPPTKKLPPPTPEPELGSLRGSVDGVQQDSAQNRCPYCNSEISISGIVRPDGFVVCPKCFKRFMPEKL